MKARIALAAAATACAAGCSGPSAPSPPATQPPTAAPPSPSTPALPPRPLELRLDTVNPCTLLTDPQRTALGVSAGIGDTDTDDLGSPGCLWNNATPPPDDSWIAKTITKRGTEYALGSVTATKVVDVGGFPAVQTATAYGDPAHECLLFIDTAQGQSLQVEYLNQRGDHPGISHETACQLATTAATDMITTLRSGQR
jgi:hypothetical protein